MTCPVSHSKVSIDIEYSRGHMFLKASAPSIAHDRISQAFRQTKKQKIPSKSGRVLCTFNFRVFRN